MSLRNTGAGNVPHTSSVAEPERITLTADQVGLMNEALEGASPHVLLAAARIAQGLVVTDDDADTVVGALTAVMLTDYTRDEGLTDRGNEIDGLIGVVQQMAEHFFD